MRQPVATIGGVIRNDAFYFSLTVNGKQIDNIILDTGAFELTFNGHVARGLGLQNLGSVQIGGIGGTSAAYKSECRLKIGKHTYANVPCIVDPGFRHAGLFGLRFFIDNHLDLELNPVSQRMTIYSA